MAYFISLFILISSFSYIKKKSKSSWITIFTFIMIGIGLQVITRPVIIIVDKFVLTENGLKAINQIITETNLIFTIVDTGIISPIIEEYIFRKGIQKKLMTKLNIRIALILQSIIFGIIHLNLYQFFPAMILGLIFGYFYYKFDSLYIPIILHISLNTYTIIGIRLIQNNAFYWRFSTLSLVLGLFLLYTSSYKNKSIMLTKTWRSLSEYKDFICQVVRRF